MFEFMLRIEFNKSVEVAFYKTLVSRRRRVLLDLELKIAWLYNYVTVVPAQ
jgi:hypothetical protein